MGLHVVICLFLYYYYTYTYTMCASYVPYLHYDSSLCFILSLLPLKKLPSFSKYDHKIHVYVLLRDRSSDLVLFA